MTQDVSVAAVVIGRNEGARLVLCLASLQGLVDRIVYVDSASQDDSVANARAVGAEVVELDMDVPFTAARARNAGLARLKDAAFIQIVDGDCEVDADWIPTALEFLTSHPDVAAVCGQLRERFPEATVWNRLAQAEWDAPVGEAAACGGIAMLRMTAVRAVGGFREDLIAGEEPEMCLRLRRQGHKIWRLDQKMALHDIAMTRFGQWWTRTRRGGYAFAAGAALHGAGPEQYRRREVSRALLWGLALPCVAVLGAVFAGSWALLLLLLYPIQILRLRLQKGERWDRSIFLTLGKLAEAQGILGFHWKKITGQQARLIEFTKDT